MKDTLRVSISKKAYTHKPTQEETKYIRFEHKEITIDEFIDLIGEGYTYAALFRNDWRKGDNYICSSTLTFDIDHSDVNIDDYVARLDIKPTFAYTSSRNGLEDYGYGFRLVYVLSEDVCSLEDYALLTKSLAKQLSLTFVDGRSWKGDQMWYGSKNCEFIISYNILDRNLINCDNSLVQTPRLSNKKTRNQKGQSNYNSINKHYGLSDPFQTDFENMGFAEFIEKYKDVCINKETSDIELNKDDIMIKYPNDYYEIRRPYSKDNGETIKIKDGEGRRKKLFINGVIRRKISPNMTMEDMIYCMVYELCYYVVNNGNKITKGTLYQIAKNVMEADVDKYDVGKPRYKSFINPLYCEVHGITKKQAMGLLRNKKQYIGEFFDPSLTVKENIAVMKEYGLEISEKTVKRWMKENGITKYNKKKENNIKMEAKKEVEKPKTYKELMDYFKDRIEEEHKDKDIDGLNEMQSMLKNELKEFDYIPNYGDIFRYFIVPSIGRKKEKILNRIYDEIGIESIF